MREPELSKTCHWKVSIPNVEHLLSVKNDKISRILDVAVGQGKTSNLNATFLMSSNLSLLQGCYSYLRERLTIVCERVSELRCDLTWSDNDS